MLVHLFSQTVLTRPLEHEVITLTVSIKRRRINRHCRRWTVTLSVQYYRRGWGFCSNIRENKVSLLTTDYSYITS